MSAVSDVRESQRSRPSGPGAAPPSLPPSSCWTLGWRWSTITIIIIIIIIMKVEHGGSSGEFLARMRGYMPPVQRGLIAWVTGAPGLRSAAEVSN